jgi:hypothetical protein
LSVANDVEQLRAAAGRIAAALVVTRTSRPVARRHGDGYSLYLHAERRPTQDTGGPR